MKLDITNNRYEFIALAALVMALNALAIDIMLPALPEIGDAIAVVSENHRQYVITSFLIGFGISNCFLARFAMQSAAAKHSLSALQSISLRLF